MNDAYRQLNDCLPARAASGAAAFASDVRTLRVWLAALPMANAQVAVKRLLDGLRALNAQALDGARRLDALETLREAALQLGAGVDKQILGASFPLPPQKAELGEIALALQAELAGGYRLALSALCAPQGAAPFLRAGQVALAAVRAQQHGEALLAKAYLLYRTPPAGAWLALHAVFGFAASLRLDDRAVEDAAAQESVTARQVYLRALLFALANPYRHTQREQGDVQTLAQALAPHCTLRSGGSPGAHDVAIQTDADRGPGYLPDERAGGPRHALVLQLDAMLAFVDQQLEAAAGARTVSLRRRGGAALPVSADLLRRFAFGCSARGEREHERLGGGYVLDSVLGLHDLHFVLADGEDFDTFMRHVQGEAISLSEGDRGAATWRVRGTAGTRATRLVARVLDQSPGGYRLVWERASGAELARVRVSELVGLALPEGAMDAHTDWMVGVIRWLRIDDGGHVDAGVELLARRALPVGVRPLDGAARPAVRGLLLASLAAAPDEEHDLLLVSTEVDRATQAVELTVPADLDGPPAPAHSERVDGLRLLESSGIHHHFILAPRAGTADDPSAAAAPMTSI